MSSKKHEKVSYGIILFDVKLDAAMLVKSRYSYEYVDFVHGRYVQNVSHLFQCMSIEELNDIYSLNFDRMWDRIWLGNGSPKLRARKKMKFIHTWLGDGGAYLQSILYRNTSLYHGARWNYPKGRQQSCHELGVDCAIREFNEETGITRDKYRIIPGFKYVFSFVKTGVKYIYIYFGAIARDAHLQPTLGVSAEQIAEIADIRWCTLDELKGFDRPELNLEAMYCAVLASLPDQNILKNT